MVNQKIAGQLFGLKIKDIHIEYKQRIILNNKLQESQQTIRMTKKENNVEFQAIMNLLYIGDDQEHPSFNQIHGKSDFGVLKEHHNKIKSNTIHLRTNKKTLSHQKNAVQSFHQSLQFRKRPSQNKENLKKILKKLENSPPPPSRRKNIINQREFDRIQTQISEPSSKSKSKYQGNKSLQLTKKSLNTFFDKKKDKQLIKSLIKAKILQKMKKVQMKKNEKKVYNFGLKTDTLRNMGEKTLKQPRTSVLMSEKSGSRTNFLNLLWQQKKANNPVLSRKSSKINLKQLLT